ncbi:MAG: response regulator [Dysgonamonadaceae bacterium]|nr:response regulator [Dysgonamonadaceae bacterium]
MMNNLAKVVAIAFLLLKTSVVFSQTTKFYSTENGLSSSLVNQVFQDKKGFIWIATEDGLNKFDGNKFVVYRSVEGDSTSLKNNYVKSLFEDSHGNFWIGCIDGLMLFDRDTDIFKEMKLYDANGERVNAHVVSIIERRNGDILFATSGASLFSLKKGETQCRHETELNKRLCSRFLTVVFEDSQNRLWFGSELNGLNLYHPGTNKIELFKNTSENIHSLSSNAISSICEDKSGNIFIGTLFGGLNRIDPTLSGINRIDDVSGNNNLPIKALIVDKNDNLYAGIDGKGIKVYNSQTQILGKYESFSSLFDFSRAKVHSLVEDKDGNIWAGVFQKGIFFIPSNPNGFDYYGYKSFRKNYIGSNSVMAICEDSDGIIWVGTDSDGLYSIDERMQRIRHFDGAGMPSSIMCMKEDQNGNLWMGSYLKGLTLFDRKSGKCTFYTYKRSEVNLADNKIFCMETDDNNHLWVGTYGGGLYCFDLHTKSIVTHYYQQGEGDHGIPNNWINALLYDNDSSLLWAATYNGLGCLNLKNNVFENYTLENYGLPSNIVFSLKKDNSGNLWIGTNSGLACLNKKTGDIKSYTIADGLSSNTICAIEIDEDNNIWVSTLWGISKINPENDIITVYSVSDGLQGNEFTRGARCKSPDGKIFFGGVNGITAFYPKDFHKSKGKLSVYITDFYVFDRHITKGQKSGNKVIFKTSILDADKISLSAKDNVFSFEFSSLEYGNPEGILYKYYLEGFDVSWLSTSPGVNKITYTNLQPGTYKFHIKAYYEQDNQSEIKIIVVTIRPPWYMTWWAKAVYVLLLLVSLYLVYSFLHSKIRHKNELVRLEHADQINEAKLQFFINISHEIRTPMTLIIGPLEKLLKENENPVLQQSYLLIYRNAQRILRLINQLMDVRKIDREQMHLKSRETDMVGFIKDVMQSFEYAAKKKNTRFVFEHEMPDLKVWVDLNNFDKVLFNILSNAFKYTNENGEIIVRLKTGEDKTESGPLKNYFEISVEDNGIGIDKDKIDKIFERFYQIDNDVTNSNFGTGIGLHLSRSLVELQYGTIKAYNKESKSGSCFLIRLPMGKDHFKSDEIEIMKDDEPLATFVYAQKDNLLEYTFEESDEVVQKIKPKTKYRILIVEDEPEINNYIRTELSEIYKINQCVNGKEALDFILKEKPDLVISDVMMPEMDGITLCRKIKSNVNINHIPIILLTAKSKEEDLAEGLETGADAYIVKPFNSEILKKTVSNLLENRERLKGKFVTQSEGKLDKIELKSSDEILMEKILKFINKNLDNTDLNVEMLSSEVGISRVHMHRKLKELTNMPARDFIRNIRLKQAGILLKEKKLSISEVAYAVGFSTLSHFSSSFKEFYGMSPKEYVESLR